MFEFYAEKTGLTGNVVNVYKDSCIIEIEEWKHSKRKNYKTVHFELYLSENITAVIPEIGDRLSISDYYKHKFTKPRNVFVKSNAVVLNNNTHDYKLLWTDNVYVNFVRANKLTIEQLITFKTFYPTLNFKNYSSFEIKLRILDYLHQEGMSFKGKLKIPIFKTVRECTYASNETVLKSGPATMHGLHCSKKGEYLIGLLKINEFGLLQLEVENFSMVVKISIDDNYRINSFLNKLIIVRKFICVTESYKSCNQVFDFVMFNEEDMFELDLDNKEEKKCLIFETIPKNRVFKSVLSIYLKSISPSKVTKSCQVQCWLEVVVIQEKFRVTCFLCLPQTHISLVPLLQAGKFYTMHMNKNLEPFADGEISRVNYKNKSFIISDPNTIFVLGQGNMNEQFDDNSSGIDLTTTVIKKFLGDPDSSSRTKQPVKMQFYGIPGDFVPAIHFSNKKKMFLNNWEPKSYPFGLLPEFNLKITNITEKNSYYLTNAFTNIQILSYNGNHKINTTNLANPQVNPEIVYGYLGNGHVTPNYCVVRSLVTIVSCKSFKINFEKETLNLRSSIYVQDCKGESIVLCNLFSILEKMLAEVKLQSWKNIFERMEKFSIYLNDNSEVHPDFYQFCKFFIEWLNNLFSLGIVYLDISCRKLDETGNTYDNKGCPLWYAIEINDVMF